jgi:hypothetical protein
MKIYLIIGGWVAIAALLVAGLVMAVQGAVWLLVLGVVGFCLALAKIGCLHH